MTRFEDPQFKATNPAWWARRRLPGRERAKEWICVRRTERSLRFLEWLAHREGSSGVSPHLLKRLQADHYEVPQGLCTSEALRPGVVGLLVYNGEPGAEGFVSPLSARLSPDKRWTCHHDLPFTTFDLLTLLSQLIASLGDVARGVLPESLAFCVETALRAPIQGRSMHMAGLLAVVRGAHSQPPPVLGAVAALVEPDGARLIEVGHAALKLQAFVRELDRGTLLIRAPCGQAARFDARFDEVWEVENLQELAMRLFKAGLLVPLLRAQEVDAVQFKAALAHAQHMGRASELVPALHMVERLSSCTPGRGVSARSRRSLAELECDLHRHLGHYDRAVELAREQADQVAALGERSSYDSLVQAEVRLAAAFYDKHDFEALVERLTPWWERCAQEPRLVDPHTRVMLFNTLGRGEAVLGRSTFAERFRASLRLQEGADLENEARTRNYLIHAHLKNGQLEAAQAALEENAAICSDTDTWQAFYRADLARRRGQVWSDPALECSSRSLVSDTYAAAFYFQATARMPGRSAQDARARLGEARRHLTWGIPEPAGTLRLLDRVLELAEASLGDGARWGECLKGLEEELRRSGFRGYYRRALEALHGGAGAGAVEGFMARVPYF